MQQLKILTDIRSLIPQMIASQVTYGFIVGEVRRRQIALSTSTGALIRPQNVTGHNRADSLLVALPVQSGKAEFG